MTVCSVGSFPADLNRRPVYYITPDGRPSGLPFFYAPFTNQ
ncbi:hypothetical protein [Morganella morganii IS15]|nr:hypothetical protein [Morganella morganii IS15]